jgi:uncharacterized protein involved in outer membrane biogenesis
MVRRIRKITIGILIGSAIALVIAWFNLGNIMQWGIEQNASTALGVPTHIGKLNLSLTDGTVGINRLTINNPNGFSTPYLLKVNSFDVKLKPMSLIAETIEIQRVELDGLEINVEQKFTSNNILTIGEKLQQRRGEESKQGDRGEKKVKAGYVSIKNVKANVKLSALGRTIANTSVQVPSIELKDIGSDNSQGVLMSEFMRKLLREIFTAVTNQVKASLPHKPF